jgi:hypothetical protein
MGCGVAQIASGALWPDSDIRRRSLLRRILPMICYI